MPTPETLPLRWFVFKMPGSSFPRGSLSRTEDEARADVQRGLARSRCGKHSAPPEPAHLTRDDEAEARANARLHPNGIPQTPSA